MFFNLFSPPRRACSRKGWFGAKRPDEAVPEEQAVASQTLKRRKKEVFVRSDAAQNVERQLVEGREAPHHS